MKRRFLRNGNSWFRNTLDTGPTAHRPRWLIRSETLFEGCKGWERKAYEFPGHKVYSIAVDSLFFLSFTKRVFRHPDLPASSPVKHFASGNLKTRCRVAILAAS